MINLHFLENTSLSTAGLAGCYLGYVRCQVLLGVLLILFVDVS